jgi:hypothetical protein
MKAGQTSIELVAVSCPGGMARQYRVQVASPETACHWRMVGSFKSDAAADRCADRWRQAGARARIIECRALPTAA